MRRNGYIVDSERRSVVYAIPTPEITDAVMADLTADEYQLKDGHHITVVPADTGRELSAIQFGQVIRILGKTARPNYSFSNTVYEISRPKIIPEGTFIRNALVVPVEAAELDELFSEFNAIVEPDIIRPFWHVTLATKPDQVIAKLGIGISSRQEWMDLQPMPYARNWQA